MGIDVYMSWRNKTKEEEAAQYTGFRTDGASGYLRESYHGEIYATHVLMPEAFGEFDYGEPRGAQIPARVLADRIEATVKAVIDRYEQTYQCARDDEETKRAVRNFVDFVELAKSKEAETGEPVWIRASW